MIDRPLAPCPRCHRHVAGEPACPFCGEQLASAPVVKSTLPGRFSRAAVFAGATLAGCWTSTPATETTTTTTTNTKTNTNTNTKPPDTGPGRLEGVLATQGSSPGNVAIVLSGPRGEYRTRSAPDGTFVFENIPPGDYTLSGLGAAQQVHIASGANPQVMLAEPDQRNYRRHRAPNMPYGAPPARYRIV